MYRRKFALGAAIALVMGIAAPASAQQPPDCNRACLTGYLDRYLDALARHDAAGLPLARNIHYTENGQRIGFTDGLWQTVKGAPTYRLDVVDEGQGSIGMLGVIHENTNANFISVRLKIEKGKITEIENLIARNVMGNSMSKPEEHTKVHPLFLETVPAAERLSREQLVRIANSYFTGLDTGESGANIPFDPDCQRTENGMITANSPDPKASEMARMGCKAQFDTGFSAIVTDIRGRRFEAVDPEHGLVYALGFFDHNGAVTHYTQPDGKVVEMTGSILQPFSFMIAEVFKVKKGKIRQIEAVLTTVPYGMTAGW